MIQLVLIIQQYL